MRCDPDASTRGLDNQPPIAFLILAELADTFHTVFSTDAVGEYIHRYEHIVAARHQDSEQLRDAYANIPDMVLSIDGLQPEKGHETLYVVRELNAGRVWFAAPKAVQHGSGDRGATGARRGDRQGARQAHSGVGSRTTKTPS